MRIFGEGAVTVGELKARLATLDDALLVVMSKDGEGNGFSPLADVDPCEYLPEETWCGGVKFPGGDVPPDLEDWDPATNVVNSICLWPTN